MHNTTRNGWGGVVATSQERSDEHLRMQQKKKELHNLQFNYFSQVKKLKKTKSRQAELATICSSI